MVEKSFEALGTDKIVHALVTITSSAYTKLASANPTRVIISIRPTLSSIVIANATSVDKSIAWPIYQNEVYIDDYDLGDVFAITPTGIAQVLIKELG